MRQVIETFATIDEDGNRVIVTRLRTFQTIRKSDGSSDEVENTQELQVDGEAITPVEDSAFSHQIPRTGKKLRLP